MTAARLLAVYGVIPPVVIVTGPPADGITIGRAQRPETRLPHLDHVHAVIPGKQPLEKWVRRRLTALTFEAALDDARELQERHAVAFRALTNGTVWERLNLATVHALREHDPHLADLERLYLNGVTYERLAELTGLTAQRVYTRVDAMRSLGFELPHRLPYARRF